jgi:hypothetical protein
MQVPLALCPMGLAHWVTCATTVGDGLGLATGTTIDEQARPFAGARRCHHAKRLPITHPTMVVPASSALAMCVASS